MIIGSINVIFFGLFCQIVHHHTTPLSINIHIMETISIGINHNRIHFPVTIRISEHCIITIYLANRNIYGFTIVGLYLSYTYYVNIHFAGFGFSGVGFSGVRLTRFGFSGFGLTRFGFSGVRLTRFGFSGFRLAGFRFARFGFIGFRLAGFGFIGFRLAGFGFARFNWFYYWFIMCWCIRTGMNMRKDFPTMLGAFLGSHLNPFRIISAVGTVHMTVPHEAPPRTNLIPGSRKGLTERHVVIYGMSLMNLVFIMGRRIRIVTPSIWINISPSIWINNRRYSCPR